VIAEAWCAYLLDLPWRRPAQDLLARQQAVDDRGEQLALVRQRLRLDEPGELDRLRARQAATALATAQARENADTPPVVGFAAGRDGPDPAWRAYRTPPKLGAFSLQQVPADLLRHRPQILLAESEVMQAAAARVPARRDVSAGQSRRLHPVRLQPHPERRSNRFQPVDRPVHRYSAVGLGPAPRALPCR
jgi:hypothetical protein